LKLYHFDTDFLIWAVCTRGQERELAYSLLSGNTQLNISSAAWYEFCRGPRTPQEIAVARCLFPEDGVVAMTEQIAVRAADLYRSLGSPRRRATDLVIATTAMFQNAVLLTRNARDFSGIPGLQLMPIVPE
jgi:predicted nucleic acid-binding protein